MKQLEKKDLVDGEIYKASNTCLTFIIKATKNLKNVINIPSYNAFMKSGNFNNSYLTFTNATPEEKHWLEVCIAANKFVSYEEAMKTFIPEYVECTLQQTNSDYKLGKIYKVNRSSQNVNKIESHNNQGMAFYQMNRHRFKPSTKEAYEAQFVVKQLEEPKDKVLLNRANSNHNSQTLTISKVQCAEGGIYQLGDKITVFTKDSKNKGKVFTIKSFRWNNAKTAICAITELHSKNGIGLDKIELYIEPKQKLFCTEDGVDIFNGVRFWNVNIIYNLDEFQVTNNKYPLKFIKDGSKQFSTKEKAEEYILLNKPCLSFNDISNLFPGYVHSSSTLIPKLKKLVKTKLNNKN